MAYRIEPLVTSSAPEKGLLMPHHKGRKRFHLGKALWARGGMIEGRGGEAAGGWSGEGKREREGIDGISTWCRKRGGVEKGRP